MSNGFYIATPATYNLQRKTNFFLS